MLMVVVLFGAFIEFGKHFTKNASYLTWPTKVVEFEFKSEKRTSAEFTDDNEFKQIVKNRSKKSRFQRKSRFKSARTQSIRGNGSPNINKKLKKDQRVKTKKAKDAKAKKAAKDAKAKKAAQDKKKKDAKGKKVSVTKTDNSPVVEELPVDDVQEDNNVTSNNPFSFENNGAVSSNNDKAKQEEESIDLGPWRERLLNGTNYKAMQEFMTLYQNGGVNSQGFYTIVYEMLDINNAETRELAIKAVASLTELESYKALIFVMEQDKFSTDQAKKAESSLVAMAMPANLFLFKTVLLSETSSNLALVMAVNLIEKAAKLTESMISTTSQDQGSADVATLSIERAMERYELVLQALNTSVVNIESQEVVNLIEQAVASIERLTQNSAFRVPATIE